MAATNHTPNIELNQWVRTDPFCMDDFNADNTKIDAAIAAADARLESAKTELQTAINAKQNKITGAASTICTSNLSVNKVLTSSGGGKIMASPIGYNDLLSLMGMSGLKVKEQLDARLRVETGTYTGTGTKGAASPTSLSLGLKPMLVYIFSSHQLFMALRGMDMALCRFIPSSTSETSNTVQDTSDFTTWRCSVTWSSSGLSWYTGISGNYPMYQFNVSGDEYHYLAIGT